MRDEIPRPTTSLYRSNEVLVPRDAELRKRTISAAAEVNDADDAASPCGKRRRLNSASPAKTDEPAGFVSQGRQEDLVDFFDGENDVNDVTSGTSEENLVAACTKPAATDESTSVSGLRGKRRRGRPRRARKVQSSPREASPAVSASQRSPSLEIMVYPPRKPGPKFSDDDGDGPSAAPKASKSLPTSPPLGAVDTGTAPNDDAPASPNYSPTSPLNGAVNTGASPKDDVPASPTYSPRSPRLGAETPRSFKSISPMFDPSSIMYAPSSPRYRQHHTSLNHPRLDIHQDHPSLDHPLLCINPRNR